MGARFQKKRNKKVRLLKNPFFKKKIVLKLHILLTTSYFLKELKRRITVPVERGNVPSVIKQPQLVKDWLVEAIIKMNKSIFFLKKNNQNCHSSQCAKQKL